MTSLIIAIFALFAPIVVVGVVHGICSLFGLRPDRLFGVPTQPEYSEDLCDRD